MANQRRLKEEFLKRQAKRKPEPKPRPVKRMHGKEM